MKRLLPLLVVLALAVPALATPWDNYYVHVAAKTPAERTVAANLGMDIFAAQSDGIVGLASQKQIEGLIVRGLDVTYLALPEHAPGAAADFPSGDSQFHNYVEMVTLLQQWAADYPDLLHLYSIGQSLQGRELWTVKISDNVQTDESAAEAGFIVMGQHHAREHISREVPLGFIQYLLETYDVLYSTTRLVDSTEIWVTPTVNPDGAEFDISTGSYVWQRKNMRDYPASCFGVDINRNYGYQWGGDGSSSDECDETYRGASAFSEPETQHVRDHVSAHPNTTILVSYHNYDELVLYPWGYTTGQIPHADLVRHQTLAQAYANLTGYTAEQSSSLYTTSGDTTDWAYGALGITSFTVELYPDSYSYIGFYVPGNQIQDVIDANLPAIVYMLSNANTLKEGRAAVGLDQILADVAEYKSWKTQASPAPARHAAERDLACGVLSVSSESQPLWGPLVIAAALLVPALVFLIRRRNRR